MIMFFTLRGKEPVAVLDSKRWSIEQSQIDPLIARTAAEDGSTVVSTVFLGVDHSFSGNGSPMLFETMIFGGKHNQECWRCSTWDDSLKQHQMALALVASSNPEMKFNRQRFRTKAYDSPTSSQEKILADLEEWIDTLPDDDLPDDDKRSDFEKWRDKHRLERKSNLKPT